MKKEEEDKEEDNKEEKDFRVSKWRRITILHLVSVAANEVSTTEEVVQV